MAKQSLFSACKRLFRDQLSGTYEVGNNNIFLELYTQEDITNGTTIGDSSEENIVVVADDTITIPEGYTLTPVQPKKSLVIICNTFVNNGTVSMYQKAPNVLPHDLFIMDKSEGMNQQIIIPAYANNSQENNITNLQDASFSIAVINGNNGTSRQCGSGGLGSGWIRYGDGNLHPGYGSKSGSGYAFGGGAGSGGVVREDWSQTYASIVDEIYPMRASNGYITGGTYFAQGGVGNPIGSNTIGVGEYVRVMNNNFGCGGRIIILCVNFTNNGEINANGTSSNIVTGYATNAHGGASGGGAVDIFYTTKLSQGNISANGGVGGYVYDQANLHYVGAGGNGSVTLSQWNKSAVLKPVEKYMSRSNMIFFLNNYVQRLKQED